METLASIVAAERNILRIFYIRRLIRATAGSRTRIAFGHYVCLRRVENKRIAKRGR